MFKLYKRSTLNVIFLLPVAAAATGDGCSTTPEAVAIKPAEITQLLSDNTLQIDGENVFAFTKSDGTMMGLNTATGGTKGRWWLADDGKLCADWQDDDQKARCDALKLSSDKKYEWMSTTLVIQKGNVKGL